MRRLGPDLVHHVVAADQVQGQHEGRQARHRPRGAHLQTPGRLAQGTPDGKARDGAARITEAGRDGGESLNDKKRGSAVRPGRRMYLSSGCMADIAAAAIAAAKYDRKYHTKDGQIIL